MTNDALILPSATVKMPRARGAEWSLATRVGFRFAFCYWALYCLPGPLIESVPGGFYVIRPYLLLWRRVTPWIAQHFFHLSGMRVTYFLTGSGDTTLEYVQDLLYVALACAATLVWSLLDRKRKEYDTLYAWLRTFVRYTLALILFGYAMSKIVPTQFSPPPLARLAEPYGESSPMGLLWTFMGASMPYTIFGGLAEATAAILLVFRRTALLGALVAAVVLLNVVMLNFCYDVPVKLHSTTYLLMALFLLLPDVSRLLNMFLLNKTISPADLSQPHLPRRWMRIAPNVVMMALVLSVALMSTWSHWKRFEQMKNGAVPPIYGGFDVEAVEIDGKPAATIDPANADWRQMFMDSNAWLLKKADGSRNYFWPAYLPRTNSVELTSTKTRAHFKFSYVWQDPEHLVLTGNLGEKNVVAHLHKINEKNFLLTHRGFHWISEQAFNR